MFTYGDLVAFLRYLELCRPQAPDDIAAPITGFSAIDRSLPGTLSWSRSTESDLSQVNSLAVIVPCGARVTNPGGIAIIYSHSPRLAFVKAMERFLPAEENSGISDEAHVEEGAVIGEGVEIGPYAYISPGARIGDGTIIRANVSIYGNVTIGSHCRVHSGVVIGTDGYGYEREIGTACKFRHIGGVVIGNDVEIGANTCIDRGTLYDTVVEDGAKIDNLCHIAHNVVIGKNVLVIACSMIGGSALIGEGAWLAPGVRIRDGITVGRGATCGMGAVVVRDVGDEEIVAGVPAKPSARFKKPD